MKPFSGSLAPAIVDPDPDDPKLKPLFSKLGSHPAVTVPVQPMANASNGYCYWNVASLVSQYGGHIQFGWQITQVPRFFIQAIHHAVWRDNSGSLIDPTEKISGSPEICTFCPTDDSIDYNSRERVPKKIWTVKHMDAKKWRDYDLKHDQLRIQVIKTGGARWALAEMEKFNKSERPKWVKYERLMLHKSARPNEPCPCGSGQNYKHCHGSR